jgi:hypothetical protein
MFSLKVIPHKSMLEVKHCTHNQVGNAKENQGNQYLPVCDPIAHCLGSWLVNFLTASLQFGEFSSVVLLALVMFEARILRLPNTQR